MDDRCFQIFIKTIIEPYRNILTETYRLDDKEKYANYRVGRTFLYEYLFYKGQSKCVTYPPAPVVAAAMVVWIALVIAWLIGRELTISFAFLLASLRSSLSKIVSSRAQLKRRATSIVVRGYGVSLRRIVERM
ncbi:MAG: hypothetical protein M0T74_17605 [Desulfitobacterium hafniense]|nr:hypothetical protein [Desulfitobacterium hafniense]